MLQGWLGRGVCAWGGIRGRNESKGTGRGVWGGLAAGLQSSLGASYPLSLRRPPALPPPEASVAAAVSASFCSSCSSSPQNRMFSAAEASLLPKPQLPSGALLAGIFPDSRNSSPHQPPPP